MRGILTGFAALLAAGAASSAEAQTLRMMKSLDAPHYDGARTTWSPTSDIVNMFQDTLVALDWDGKTAIPYLAKSWDIREDGKLYTFKLRDDVSFCSGKKFTAADVVYSFKRLKDPETKAPYAWRAGDIKEVRAVDPYTVEYELNEPYSELLLQLTMYTNTIHNQESVETLGKDYGVKGIDGTGPWCFESWQPRTEIVLKRHDAYKWGPSMYANKGPVKFEKLSIKIVPEDASRVAAIMGGQFDVTHQVPLQFIDQVKATPTLTVQEAKPNFQLMYYGYKITRPMVADKRVREAMNIAINRAEIVKGIMLGNAEPALTFVDPKALDFADKTKGVIKEDVERARKLLDEAGWLVGSDGIREKDGVKLAPRVLFTQVAYFPRVSEAIQGYMRKIGIDWKITGYDFNHRAGRDGQAGLRAVDRDGALFVGGRADEHLLQLEECADTQPHELEGRRHRRVAARRPRRIERGRAGAELRPRPGEGDQRAPVDACHERRDVHDKLEETERRAAAHALSEHLLQGTGLFVLMETLLEVRGLKTHFATDRGLFRAVDGVSFSVPRGRTVGLVGEFRLRQERDLALGDGAGAVSARQGGGGGRDVRQRQHPGAVGGRAPEAARQQDVDDLSGTDDLAEPGAHRGPADRGGHRRPHRDVAAGGEGARRRDAGAGENPLARPAHRRLSAPACPAACASA